VPVLTQPSTTPLVARPPGRRFDRWRPTIRLGIVLSTVAAVGTATLQRALQVPAAALVGAVLVVGFALSWHDTTHRRRGAATRR